MKILTKKFGKELHQEFLMNPPKELLGLSSMVLYKMAKKFFRKEQEYVDVETRVVDGRLVIQIRVWSPPLQHLQVGF